MTGRGLGAQEPRDSRGSDWPPLSLPAWFLAALDTMLVWLGWRNDHQDPGHHSFISSFLIHAFTVTCPLPRLTAGPGEGTQNTHAEVLHRGPGDGGRENKFPEGGLRLGLEE